MSIFTCLVFFSLVYLQECNIDSEVCCQIRVPVTPRPTPPPTRASYIPPAPPTRSQPQPTQCYDRSSVCVPANQCYNGAVSRGSPYTSRAPVSFIEILFHFELQKFNKITKVTLVSISRAFNFARILFKLRD